ncbi:MAG: MarR family winged helix-turn-helix transcriptional regulator [Polyangiaceae bacterium]
MGSQATLRDRADGARGKRAGGPAPAASPEIRDVLNSLRHIVRSLRVSSRNAEQQVGLSGAQLFVLQCLSQQSPCSVNELAAHTATDQSSVSVVVSRLVARGYVKRSPSKLDRRQVELALTPSGRALIATAPEAAQDRLLAALAKLKKSEVRLLSALLRKVVEQAIVPRESPTLFFEDGPVLVRAKARSSHGRK